MMAPSLLPETVAVVGLGYVGLPLACQLATQCRVIGFDQDRERLEALTQAHDPRGEVSQAHLQAASQRLTYTAEPADLSCAEVVILCVPTPIDDSGQPDLTSLLHAAELVGTHLRHGATVVVESTVYPGCTDQVIVPAIAKHAGAPKEAFTWGYSPERINPGDAEHGVGDVIKVVAGCDEPTTDRLSALYTAIIPAGIHRAPSIAVAECAKVLENTQRDVNIALMNEAAVICHRLGIATADVLAAAQTKWNFLPFHPGLVGGHCIGVDPYYLTHAAEQAGYHPDVILAGRRINDGLGAWVADECVRLLIEGDHAVKAGRVLIIGGTFKPNVKDVRNSGAVRIVAELQRFGCAPAVADPVADTPSLQAAHPCDIHPWPPVVDGAAAVIICVAHDAVREWLQQTERDAAIWLNASGQRLTGAFDWEL